MRNPPEALVLHRFVAFEQTKRRQPRAYVNGWYLISGDGDLMHGVVDRLEQLQHGVQGLLQFTAVSLLRAVFQ